LLSGFNDQANRFFKTFCNLLTCFKPSAAFGILVILVSIRFIACYLLIQFLSYFNILLGFFSFFKTIRYHFGRTKIKTADDYQLLVF